MAVSNSPGAGGGAVCGHSSPHTSAMQQEPGNGIVLPSPASSSLKVGFEAMQSPRAICTSECKTISNAIKQLT